MSAIDVIASASRAGWTYNEHISQAAKEMETLMRLRAQAGLLGGIVLFSRSTTPQMPGDLVVSTDVDPYPTRCEGQQLSVVRPKKHYRWEAIPYSALHNLVWESCRHEPIMSDRDHGKVTS